MNQDIAQKLDRVFNPRTAVVLGNKQAYGYVWPMRLKTFSTFSGRLCSVQVDTQELSVLSEREITNYPSLLEVPDPIDLVVAALRPAEAPRIVRECIQKKVGGLAFITPGFSETGTDEGTRLQREITDMSRDAGLLLLGPNCWGIYNPRIGLRQTVEQVAGEAGTVGFISQGGTPASYFSTIGAQHGIKISKSVGYGNAAVLDSTDYLEYMGQDDETKIIGMNIEGVKDGKRFFGSLRQVASTKPVLIWKSGQSAVGSRVTSSHTGSLAGSSVVWQALIRQCGAIEVNSLEEMIDTVKALVYIKPAMGKRVGLIATSGGYMVAISEVFSRAGLEVPLLSKSSSQLASSIITIDGNHNNPFDLSSNFVMEEDPFPSVDKLLEILDRDDNIDCVVLQFSVGMLTIRQGSEVVDRPMDIISHFRTHAAKPFMVILTAGHMESMVPTMRQRLIERGIPIFSPEGGAGALGRIVDYYRQHGSSDNGAGKGT